jgi:hypothetical protein
MNLTHTCQESIIGDKLSVCSEIFLGGSIETYKILLLSIMQELTVYQLQHLIT